jgi:hypothetical protein
LSRDGALRERRLVGGSGRVLARRLGLGLGLAFGRGRCFVRGGLLGSRGRLLRARRRFGACEFVEPIRERVAAAAIHRRGQRHAHGIELHSAESGDDHAFLRQRQCTSRASAAPRAEQPVPSAPAAARLRGRRRGRQELPARTRQDLPAGRSCRPDDATAAGLARMWISPRRLSSRGNGRR